MIACPRNQSGSERKVRAPRVIIIDDSREYMAALRRMLATTLPNVEVTEYDPEQRGKPPAAFDWSVYDVVLLDHDLGLEHNGLDWLVEFRARGTLPPTILMTAAGDEYLAARAIKLGAWDYVRKQDATSARIGELVRAAVAERRAAADFDQTLREERQAPHLAILDELIARHRPPALEAGEGSIGYRFVRLIGQGASSLVYLAERTSDDTTLVLKVLDLAQVYDPQLVERFLREAEIVSSISSPSVVRFHDYGLTQTYGYIAMEFFTRGDLKQRLERGVAYADALNYVRHIALGLDAIHAHGIVHRDLKPGNIMFRADDTLALADFGIARRLDQTSDLTNAGAVIGTPNYLSPEQALGEAADQRADLYSVGIMLYEMLAGHKPFRAETAPALVYQHVHAEVPPLPLQYTRLQPLIERLLAKKPGNRCASASELLTALDRLQAGHAA